MARRIKVDPEALIRKIQDGTVGTELLEKFGFKSDTRPGKDPVGRAAGRRKAAAKSALAGRQVTVSKHGSIAISKTLVAALGFRIGDAFQVKPSRAGLSLTRLKKK